MKPIKTLIVDDEPLALEILETLIRQFDQLELVGSCSNAFQANNILQSETVDLIFLDIQMPILSGIDFIKSLEHPPVFIFTTAFPDYALEGFELNAIDYLLKPFSPQRFEKAVHKAMSALQQSREDFTANKEPQDEFFFVKADKKLMKVFYSDILYIEGLKDYVIIRQDKGRIITLQTMKSLEDKLPRDVFRRIHRSYIVNTQKIISIHGNHVEITEAGKVKTIPIGKNYKDELDDIINQNKL
ncbi:MAG: LytTR family DNA-binding domain-containing protein [Saprospiraceae bacterium]|nr:LytTR family DNA-binding domain-containing protein [Saprospiraceae bacterium]